METSPPTLIIESKSGWQFIDLQELYAYRDLFFFLTWRSVKVRYAQSALGFGWAVIPPLAQMVIFTVVFGYLAGMSSDGAPYSLFAFVALVPWTYFSTSVSEGANSLVANANMISKVYFPRIILPFSTVAAKLIDFSIAMVLLFVMLLFYGIMPTWGVVWLPLLVLLMIVSAAGISAWLTALAIQYRDVKHVMSFLVQIMMYAAPVIYPTSKIPEKMYLGEYSQMLEGWVISPRLIYAINPMVGVIEGFRAALLGSREMPWSFIGIGSITAIILFCSGCAYFRSRERLFADVA